MLGQVTDLRQINKQFIKYVIPSVIAMSVEAFYTVLNGIIAGQGLGEIALGAVNIALPFNMVIIALSMLVGIGGANVYSFYKGEGDTDKANNIFCQCLALLVLIGLALALAGFVFRENLAWFLGANQELFPAVTAYLKWLAPSALVQLIVFGLIIFIRNDDAPKLVMVVSIAGAAINIILDVILIFVLHYGIEMIALANGIAVLIQGLLFIPHFASKKGLLRIRKPIFQFGDIKRVLSNGLASFLMEFWLSTISFSFNLALVHSAGTIGVSAYSIVTYVCALIQMILVGVTQGAQPIMSYYHGKGDTQLFLHVYRLGMRTSIIIPIVWTAACLLFGSEIISLFHAGDPELTALAIHMFRLYPLGFIFAGPVLMNILYFQTTEQNAWATLISSLRCVGFVQVFLLLSIMVFNAKGLYLTFLAGELCHFIISKILVSRARKV